MSQLKLTLKFLCFLLCVLNSCCFAHVENSCQACASSIDFLKAKIPEGNPRYKTVMSVLNLLCFRHAWTLVETGTAREGAKNCGGDGCSALIGDGCSTLIFAEWVKNHGGKLYSVDINKMNLENAADALGDLMPFVKLIHSDSVNFLHKFRQPIDFLYLDSLDYDFRDPSPSQEHHLKEIKAAYPWLTPKAVVMIDDCALPERGKGKLVIEYLLTKGWKILLEDYQVILSR